MGLAQVIKVLKVLADEVGAHGTIRRGPTGECIQWVLRRGGMGSPKEVLSPPNWGEIRELLLQSAFAGERGAAERLQAWGRVEEVVTAGRKAGECWSAAQAVLFADEAPVQNQGGAVPPGTASQTRTEWAAVERGSQSGPSPTESVDTESTAETEVFPVGTVPAGTDEPPLRCPWGELRREVRKDLGECLLDWDPGGDVKGDLYR